MMVSAQMIFGRNIGDRPGVSDAAFSRFVDAEIAPLFPNGFTIIDGTGRWRDGARSVTVHENAKIVMMTFDDGSAKPTSLAAIAENYKKQFSQQSVMTQLTNVCVSF